MLIIVLKNPDEYNAPSVEIHIFGYAPTGTRPKQDGVRSDFFPLHIEYYMFSYFSLLYAYFVFWIRHFSGNRTVVSFIKPRMEMDGLNIKGLWFLTGPKRLLMAKNFPDFILYFLHLVSEFWSCLHRWRFHVLLFVPRAKFLMCQNGLYVRLVSSWQHFLAYIQCIFIRFSA